MYRLASIFAFLSAITTIGIHADLFSSPANSDEAMLLYHTFSYVASKWWVIFHCLFVIISAYGLSHYLAANGRSFAWLGFTFYVGFGLTEILRMFLVLTYLSGLRDRFALATDPNIKSILQISIENFNGIGLALFALFMLCIMLGNLFCGISAFVATELRWLGIGLMIWACVLAFAIIDNFWPMNGPGAFLEYFNLIFQPAIRLYLALCLFRIGRSSGVEGVRHVTAS